MLTNQDFFGVLLALHIQLLPTQLDESGETITLEGFGKNQILGLGQKGMHTHAHNTTNMHIYCVCKCYWT